MLFLSATGLTWSQFAGANVTDLRTNLDWTTPSVERTLPAGSAVTGTVGATADRVLAAARTAGLSDPVAIVPGEDRAWVVSQV